MKLLSKPAMGNFFIERINRKYSIQSNSIERRENGERHSKNAIDLNLNLKSIDQLR